LRAPYHRVGGKMEDLPDYRFLAERIGSPFFPADVVVTEDDQRYVLELGDGGTSAPPPSVIAAEFYAALRRALGEREGLDWPERRADTCCRN